MIPSRKGLRRPDRGTDNPASKGRRQSADGLGRDREPSRPEQKIAQPGQLDIACPEVAREPLTPPAPRVMLQPDRQAPAQLMAHVGRDDVRLVGVQRFLASWSGWPGESFSFSSEISPTTLFSKGRLRWVIRKAGESRQRQYGPGAAELLFEVMDEAGRQVDRCFGEQTPGGLDYPLGDLAGARRQDAFRRFGGRRPTRAGDISLGASGDVTEAKCHAELRSCRLESIPPSERSSVRGSGRLVIRAQTCPPPRQPPCAPHASFIPGMRQVRTTMSPPLMADDRALTCVATQFNAQWKMAKRRLRLFSSILLRLVGENGRRVIPCGRARTIKTRAPAGRLFSPWPERYRTSGTHE